MRDSGLLDSDDCRSDLLARFDAAGQALDSWVRLADVDGSILEARLAGEGGRTAESEESWKERWVVAPLRAAATVEALRQELAAQLAALRVEMQTLEGQAARLRPNGHAEAAARLQRRSQELAAAALAIGSRLSGTGEGHLASPVRLGHLLQRVLRRLACEVFCLVREELNEAAARAVSVLARVEEYDSLVREACSIAGPLDLPAFSRADLEAVRRQAGLTVVHLHDLAS